MNINPIQLSGNWDEGWALDKHIIHSVPIGENAYGYMQFENTYSEIGKLLYEFKNRNKYNNLQAIVDVAVDFINEKGIIDNIDIIMPVPFSKPRSYQPAFEIAHAIAEHFKISYIDTVLQKTTREQSKSMDVDEKDLTGTIIATKKAKKEHTILLIDDLFSTGATLTECVKVLKQDPMLSKIYVLAITKTKKG